MAKKNLDPSIVVAISLILKEEFKEPNIISDASSFPSMEYIKNLEVNNVLKKSLRCLLDHYLFYINTYLLNLQLLLINLELIYPTFSQLYLY